MHASAWLCPILYGAGAPVAHTHQQWALREARWGVSRTHCRWLSSGTYTGADPCPERHGLRGCICMGMQAPLLRQSGSSSSGSSSLSFAPHPAQLSLRHRDKSLRSSRADRAGTTRIRSGAHPDARLGARSRGAYPAGLLTCGSSRGLAFPDCSSGTISRCSPLTVAGAVAELAVTEWSVPHCVPFLRPGQRLRRDRICVSDARVLPHASIGVSPQGSETLSPRPCQRPAAATRAAGACRDAGADSPPSDIPGRSPAEAPSGRGPPKSPPVVLASLQHRLETLNMQLHVMPCPE